MLRMRVGLQPMFSKSWRSTYFNVYHLSKGCADCAVVKNDRHTRLKQHVIKNVFVNQKHWGLHMSIYVVSAVGIWKKFQMIMYV